MGLGGFLAAKSELDHYLSEKKREEREVVECPEEEEEECFQVLAEFGITREVYIPIRHIYPFPFLCPLSVLFLCTVSISRSLDGVLTIVYPFNRDLSFYSEFFYVGCLGCGLIRPVGLSTTPGMLEAEPTEMGLLHDALRIGFTPATFGETLHLRHHHWPVILSRRTYSLDSLLLL